MMTTEAHNGHRENRPWRSRFHRAAIVLASVVAAAIGLHWALLRASERLALEASWRFVDSFAVGLALALIAIMLGLSWRAGGGSRP